MPLDDLAASPDLKAPLNLRSTLPPSNFGSAMAGSLEQQIPGALAQDKAKTQELEQAGRAAAATIDKSSEKAGLLQIPVPPAPRPMPQYQATSPSEAWGSLAMAAAMLGSAFTRRPRVAALNAAAAVMGAYQKRDTEAYKRSFEEWKAQTEYANKTYEYQRDAYKDAIAMIQEDPKNALAKLRALSAALGDSELNRLASAGKVAEIGMLDQQRADAHTKASLEAGKMRTQGEVLGEAMDAQKSLTDAIASGDQNRIQAAQARAKAAQQNLKILHDATHATGTGGWVVLNDPANKDASGNPTPYRYNTGTAEATTLDGQPYTPGGAAKVGTGGEKPSDVRLKREDELYAGLKEEWQAKQRAEGKPDEVTPSIEAQLRSRAHASISGRGQTQMEPTLTDDALDRMADQYLAGDKSVVQGLGYGNAGAANRAALQNRISQRGLKMAEEIGIPTDRVGEFLAIKQAEFAGVLAGERTLGVRTANLGLAAQEAVLLMPTVLKASEDVPRTELTDINRLINAGNTRTGDAKTVRLGIALNSFINVYARAISPTGAPTVSDKDHARDLLAPYWTKGQIREALDQLKIEIDAALGAPARVRQEFREGAATRVPGQHAPAPSTPPTVGPAPTAPAPAGTPPRVTGQAEYDALPSGTVFTAPDGKQYRKP